MKNQLEMIKALTQVRELYRDLKLELKNDEPKENIVKNFAKILLNDLIHSNLSVFRNSQKIRVELNEKTR